LTETGERSAVLKTYIVFEPENARTGDGGERAQFVLEKFSWAALFFAPLWLLVNRLWLAFVLFCAAEILIACGVYYFGFTGFGGIAALLLPPLIVAFEGAQLKRYRLRQKYYREADVVTADDLESAERRYFERRKLAPAREPGSVPPAFPEKPRTATSVIGLFPERGR
jgi:hypothetical protein